MHFSLLHPFLPSPVRESISQLLELLPRALLQRVPPSVTPTKTYDDRSLVILTKQMTITRVTDEIQLTYRLPSSNPKLKLSLIPKSYGS